MRRNRLQAYIDILNETTEDEKTAYGIAISAGTEKALTKKILDIAVSRGHVSEYTNGSTGYGITPKGKKILRGFRPYRVFSEKSDLYFGEKNAEK